MRGPFRNRNYPERLSPLLRRSAFHGQGSVEVRRIQELRLQEQQQLEQVELEQERLRQEEITLAEAA